MLMQVQSGLTRYQVQKAKQGLQPTTMTVTPAFQFRPALLLAAGTSLVFVALQEPVVALTVFALALGLTLAAHWLLQRWVRALTRPTAVLAVRAGLVRPLTSAALVPGDVILLKAGMRLPVDVRAPQNAVRVPGGLRLLLALNGHEAPAPVAVAGSFVLRDCQAEVVALGAARFVAKELLPDWSEPQGLTLRPVVAMVRAAVLGVLAQVRQWMPRAVSLRLKKMLINIQDKVSAETRLMIGLAFMHHMSLVGAVRHQAKEVAFRYNQDPVSWRLAEA